MTHESMRALCLMNRRKFYNKKLGNFIILFIGEKKIFVRTAKGDEKLIEVKEEYGWSDYE